MLRCHRLTDTLTMYQYTLNQYTLNRLITDFLLNLSTIMVNNTNNTSTNSTPQMILIKTTLHIHH
jgi:hypothetical protein